MSKLFTSPELVGTYTPFQKTIKHFHQYHPRTQTLPFYRHGFALKSPPTVARTPQSTSWCSALKCCSGFHSLGAHRPKEFGEICLRKTRAGFIFPIRKPSRPFPALATLELPQRPLCTALVINICPNAFKGAAAPTLLVEFQQSRKRTAALRAHANKKSSSCI